MIEVHASEIHSSRTCARKWHGVYVQGLREPDSAATARGTAIHAILENYLDGKGPIDTTTEYGRIAASGLKYLPAPGTVHTELDFSFPPFADGWFYAGTIDMIRPYYVGDHKTTSDFKYQKTREVLLEDPQTILYGTKAQLDGRSDIECQWIYYRTKGANKAQETRFIYPGQLLVENKAKLDEEVRVNLSRRKLKILDIEPTPTACFKYGKPCHLRSQCTDLRPSIGSLMSISKDQLLADLKAKSLGVGANPAGVQMPPPVATVTPPSVGAGLPSLPVLGTPPGGLPALPGAAAVAAPAKPAGGLPALPGSAPAVAAVTPPAAGLPALGGLPALPGAKPIATTIAPPGSVGGPPPLPPLPPPPSIDPAVAAAVKAEADAKAAAKAKQPELPNITPVADQVTAAVMGNGPDFAGVVKPAIAANPVSTEGMAIGVLYVDCLPLNETVTPFSQIAGFCHDAVKEHMKLSHYKYAEFGKGPAAWCDTVGMYLSAVYTPALYVDTSAGDAKDALEVLLRSAARVIRGVK